MSESKTPDAQSQSEPSQPTDSAAPTKPAKPGRKPKVKDPARWRRRFVRAFMVVVIGAILFQFLLWAILPWTLHRVAKFYDLDLTCGRPDLYLFSSDAGLWHVNVKQHGQLVASVDYCRADVSILNLLRGRLVIQRLEADGVDLTVRRDADGSIPLLKGLLSAGPQPGAAPAPARGAKPAVIDLRPPVAIDALVLTRVQTHLIDRAVTPNLNTQVQMNLRLTDLASPERPAKLGIELFPSPSAPPLLDSIEVVAENRKINDSKSLDAHFHAMAHGLHPKLLAGYLARFGVKVTADGLTLNADGNIDLAVLADAPDSVGGKIKLDALSVSDDGRDAVAMKSIIIDIDSFHPGGVRVGKVLMEDGTFVAGRTSAGGLSVAGMELTGDASPSSASTTPPSVPASPFDWSLGQFTLKNFKASFTDSAIKPAANLEFLVRDLTLKNLVNDPALPGAAASLTGEFSSPGLVSSIALTGKCVPFAAKKTVDLSVQGTGVRPEALRPYLEALGIRSELKDGAFTCQAGADLSIAADGRIAANARLRNIKFTDGKELVALDDIHLSGIALTPGSIRVDAIDVVGPRVAARRDKSGAIVAVGFAYDPNAARTPRGISPAPVSPSKATTQRANPAETLTALPRIDIGRFRWTKIQVQLDDDAAPEGKPTALAIQDAAVELTGLHLDFDPKGPVSTPGHLHAFLKAPGLAGDIEVQGTFTQRPGGMSADVDVTGKNLSAILAAPYLKALNIEPTLADGSVHTKAHVEVAQNEKEITASVSAGQFALKDGETELLGADQAAIDGIHIAPGLMQVDELILDKPRGRFARDEGGAIRALGFRILPAPPVEKKSAFATARAAPATQPAAHGEPGEATPVVPPDVLVLKKLTLRDGAFGWEDRAVKPAAKIVAHVNGDIANVTWGKVADPATFSFALKADGIVDEAKIAGTLAATSESAMTKADISATGLKQGALASYLPPGTTVELKDGRFHMSLEAALAQNPQGSAGGHLTIHGLDYRDGTDGPALFSLEAVNVAVPRVDIPGGVVAVDEISVTGAETRGSRSKDGTLHLLGLAIATPPPAAIPPAPATQPAAAAPVALPPLLDQPSRPGGLVIAKKKYPQVTVKKLDLNVRKLEFADAARDKTPPIVVSDLRFFARKPIEALGKNPGDAPAIDLGLTLKVEKVLDSLNVTIGAAPFAGEPTLAIDITGAGLHGDGLLAQAPDLADKLNAAPLTDGRFHAHLFAKLKMDRLEPIDFPLDRAFDAEFVLNQVEFRSAEKGPVLAALEEVRSENIRVQPASHLITLNSIEINNLSGQATRETDGIHALGVVIKMPAATQPATPEPKAHPASTVVTAVAAPASAPTQDDSTELRINRISASGIDFRVTDNTVSPPLLIPINQLDLDARNISSKAMAETRPATKFSLLVGAGKVPLAHRLNHNALAGALKDTGKLLAGEKIDTTVRMEDRDLFSQIEANGELTLYPQPKGWLKMSVSAFDLASLKSTVKQFGPDLSQGIFDTNVDVKLPGDGSMTTTSALSLTDLDLSEGSNGPIARYLKLAVPLNDAKGLIEDSDGSIIIPLDFTVHNGKLSGGEIAGAAVNAIGAVLGRAVASAPAKTLNAVGDVTSAVIPIPGLFGDKKSKVEIPIVLSFSPGDDAISPQSYVQLSALLKRMRNEPNLEITLRSDLSGGPRAASGEIDTMTGDISRARERANPSPEDCRELINRISRRRDDLTRTRLDLLGQARGDVASKSPAQSAETLTRLRAVERDLAAADDALDRLYDLQRPGADRQAGRRTKQAALAVARSREESVAALLSAGGPPDFKDRLKTTRPQFGPSAGADDAGGSVVITINVKKRTD